MIIKSSLLQKAIFASQGDVWASPVWGSKKESWLGLGVSACGLLGGWGLNAGLPSWAVEDSWGVSRWGLDQAVGGR